jgi:HK97 family phage prohead protease/HK97 family phage major capsid protein
VIDRIVRFSTDITAADVERRTIVGTVVPYGTIGNTSIGPVTFAPGSIRAGQDVKLVLEHDLKRPIGRSTGLVDGPERLVGSFRLSHTTAASDALVEASDGLRDGLSVGARILEHTVDASGTMIVTAADLVEVSLVHTPAFSDAVVTQVAASAEEGDTPDESEEDIVSNETTEVVATEVVAAEPVVEAARPSMPYITAQPRDLKGLTAGGMLRAQIQAQMGSHDAQMLVQAALGAQTTTQDAGVIPVPLLREIISTIDNQRPFINSIDRQPLPEAGMTFRIPKVTTAVSVGKQATQNTELNSTQGKIEDITVTVETFGGANKVSRQLIERSDPSYFDELLRQLAAKFANETDKAAHLAAATTAVASAGAAGAGIYSAVVKGIADSYGVMRFEPNRLHVNPTGTASPTWFDLLSEVDQQGRPLFAAAAPQNAGGLVTQGSTNGTVAGLSVVVNPNATTNSQALVYPSAAATFYESAGAPVRVELSYPDTLSVDVGVYGYVALALKHPTAFRKLTVTPAG